MPRNVIYQYVKDITSGRIASGFNHCNRVYHLARKLGIEDYDDDVLHASCFLHDLIVDGSDTKYEKSAVKAEQLLHEAGFPADKIAIVKECIMTHIPEGQPEIKEAVLLHDANLLDNLGAIGVVRLSIGAFFWYQLKTLTDVLNLIKKYKDKSQYLITNRAKEMAESKIKFMETAIQELEAEENL